jgi:hypothetical protein
MNKRLILLVPILSQMNPVHTFPPYFPRIYSDISRDSSVGIALDYGLDDRGSGFDSQRRLGIFLITASRMALGLTQHPIQWVPGVLSLGVKRLGVVLTTYLNLVPRSRMRGAIPPLPQYAFMAWCSVKKSTDTTLTFTILILSY